jgi:predicted dehydrogenase
MAMAHHIGVGVVGCGYWGPNLVRNFGQQAGARVVGLCDSRLDRAAKVARDHHVEFVTDSIDDFLALSGLDLVVIATPSATHFDLARRAIACGKHVLVMKPLTTRVDHAEELVHLSERAGVMLAVDHTFVYTGAVRKMRELVESGSLGDIYYIDSVRINLGLFQTDVNVVWDLAPHDISIIDHVLGGMDAQAVATVGGCHAGSRHENIAYVTVQYGPDILAHIHVNWLAPAKVRRTIIGGSKSMIIYDDTEPSEKLKIYDSGVNIAPSSATDDIYSQLVSYRSGDMRAPKIDGREALSFEAEHILDCIRNGSRPIADGAAGVRVVRIVEAAQTSLDAGSGFVSLTAARDARRSGDQLVASV